VLLADDAANKVVHHLTPKNEGGIRNESRREKEISVEVTADMRGEL
jgi:hypothetical protein